MVCAQGKVVFLAPTKPLVHQQFAACQAFMGSSKARAHPLCHHVLYIAIFPDLCGTSAVCYCSMMCAPSCCHSNPFTINCCRCLRVPKRRLHVVDCPPLHVHLAMASIGCMNV